MGAKGKGPAPKKKESRMFRPTREERKEATEKEVSKEMARKESELGAEEHWRIINERIRLQNEAAAETVRVEEARKKKEREIADRRIERMELDEEEDDVAQIVDNDFVVHPPSPRTLEQGMASNFGGPQTEILDVRVKDAQRDAQQDAQRASTASVDQRKVMISSDKENEGGREDTIPLKYLQEEEKKGGEEGMEEDEECTPYEEDEREEEEIEENKKRKEEDKERKEKGSQSRRDRSYIRDSSRQAKETASSTEED